MGKFRVEAVGLEQQSDVEKGFQPFREDIAPFDDEKNAIASAKACAELYADDVTVVVVEKRKGRWYTHFTIKGKADTDKHGPRKKENLGPRLVDKVKQRAAASS